MPATSILGSLRCHSLRLFRLSAFVPSRRTTACLACRMTHRAVVSSVLAAAICGTLSMRPAEAAPTHPTGQTGSWILLKDWTFGRNRVDATIHNKAELDRDFYYRYIYDGGQLDRLPTYWSIHRDYPEGDPRSLHVFSADALTLKGRIPAGGGLKRGGIESGMLRGKFPIQPGMYIEMRARLPKGVGVWPAFWLNPGIQDSATSFSAMPWPPEIDIFEFLNWQHRPRTLTMESNVQVDGHPGRYGYPHDEFTLFKNREYTPGFDFSAGFHVFALDWRKDDPRWLLDGKLIKQTHYEWHAPAAHLLVTNQLGIGLPKADMGEMTADEGNWDYVIDYIRIWTRGLLSPVRAGSAPILPGSRSGSVGPSATAIRRRRSPRTHKGCPRLGQTA